jgi:transcriptional antiterminator RfaH
MDQNSRLTTAESAWYCARTQPKHEQIAARSLRSRFGLDVFNPRLKMERSTRRGVVRVIEPLFPCYVFVRCDLSERIDQIRHTNGISSLVRFGVRIPTVPDEVVEELRQCFETEEPMEVEDRLTPGSSVTLVEGPFLGTQGVIVRVLPAKRRVQILLDFLGQTTLTEVDRKALAVDGRSLANLLPRLSTLQQMGMDACTLSVAV